MEYGTNYDESDLIQDGKRKRLSVEESEILLDAFARNPRPNQDERNELSHKLGINSRNIQIWFQNRRAKLKRESNDPDLFSVRPVRTVESQENYVLLPVVTAGNFKELCLPKYLDIPIKGQQLSTEDISKNDAIRKFWKKQQEDSVETPISTPTKIPKIMTKNYLTNNYVTAGTTPPSLFNNTTKKVKTMKQTANSPEDLKFEENSTTCDMPDLLPFNDITNNHNNRNSSKKTDFNNLTFLTQSIKDINNQGIIKMNFYRPQLDTVATNVDFLFNPDKNAVSLELLGNPKKSSYSNQLDKTFTEIFSSLPDMSL